MFKRPQRCSHCGGRFGLIRHYWYKKSFCKKACLLKHRSEFYHSVADFFVNVEGKLLRY